MRRDILQANGESRKGIRENDGDMAGGTMSYVYIRSEPQLWTVGFYKPDGKWEPESDHDNERKLQSA